MTNKISRFVEKPVETTMNRVYSDAFRGVIEMGMVELSPIMMQETFDSRFEQAQYDEAEIQDQSFREKISAHVI